MDFRLMFHNILIYFCPSIFAFSVLFSSFHGNMCMYVYIYIYMYTYVYTCMHEYMRAKLSDFVGVKHLLTDLVVFSDLVWICTDLFA